MASYAGKRSFSAVCLANSGCERWRVEAAVETLFWYRRAGEPGTCRRFAYWGSSMRALSRKREAKA
jgi:hypothetical protein